jgi:transcriptional regulator with XRE-family HTH domain
MGVENRFAAEKIRFGTKCKTIRKDRKIIQSKMKHLCNLAASRVSEIEHGKNNVEFETLYKLRVGLKLEIADLFNTAALIPLEKLVINDLTEEKLKFSNRLTELLNHRAVNQRDLSILIMMGEGEISDFIKGKHNIVLFSLVKIAEALKVEVFDLFDYNGPLPDNANYKEIAISL